MRDHVVSTRRVVMQQERYRAVDSNSMFLEIERAYTELRESLERAAGFVEEA